MALQQYTLTTAWTEILGAAGTLTIQNQGKSGVRIEGAASAPSADSEAGLILPDYGDFLQLEFATKVYARAQFQNAVIVAGTI